MHYTIRYFKYIDPITGTLTKGYGYTTEGSVTNLNARVEGDTVVFKKHEVQEVTSHSIPKYEGVTEITKADFDALSTAGESLTNQLNRERAMIQFGRIAKRKPKEVLTKDDLEQKVTAALINPRNHAI